MHPLQDSVCPKHKHLPLPKPTSEKLPTSVRRWRLLSRQPPCRSTPIRTTGLRFSIKVAQAEQTSEKALQYCSFGQVYGLLLGSARSALLTRPGVTPEKTPYGVDIGVVLLDEGHVAAGLEYHEREVRSQEDGTTELVVEWAELVWEPVSD